MNKNFCFAKTLLTGNKRKTKTFNKKWRYTTVLVNLNDLNVIQSPFQKDEGRTKRGFFIDFIFFFVFF